MIDEKPFRIDDPARWPHYYPYLVQIYRDMERMDPGKDVVLQKSAQGGASELAINASIWAVDQVKADVMYLLPTREEATDFSAGRFNPAIEESPALTQMFDDVSNVNHKRAGAVNYYIRGTQKRSQLKSVPIDFLIEDEYDEMVQANLPLAETRLDASPLKWKLRLSTPTIPEYGINKLFLASDQRQYFVKCPHCGQWQRPTYRDNVEAQGNPPFYRCAKCGRPTNSLLLWPGEWVATYPGRLVHGYQFTQLLSPHITAKELVDAASKPGAEAEQEFFNSKLGEPHVVKGGQLSEDILNACREPGYKLPSVGRHCTMGVDVGKVLNVRISNWVKDGAAWKKVARYIGTVPDFSDLDQLMQQYDVDLCVVDALPETRSATAFAERHAGRVFLAYYNIPVTSKEYTVWDDDTRVVRVQRTLAMTGVMERYISRGIVLPESAEVIPDLYEQLKAPKRVLKKDERTGNPVYVFMEDGKPDHYFHAEVYDDVAGSRWIERRPADPAALAILRGLKVHG